MKTHMDRSEFVKAVRSLADSCRETLATQAIAHVVYLTKGDFEAAEWALREAGMAAWRVEACQIAEGDSRTHDEGYRLLYDQILSGEGMHKVMKAWHAIRAQRAYREFQAAWRLFAEEGIRLGPHLMENLYELDPTEREKKIRGYAPTLSDIKDVEKPCGHDLAPVIYEGWPYDRYQGALGAKVICTECLCRFSAEVASKGAVITRMEHPETSDIHAKITKVIRPLVRD